jgi:hypothetical protein
MSFILTNNFIVSTYAIRFVDGGGVTWSLNTGNNTITATVVDPANDFLNDLDAAAGGVPVGGLYHNAGAVRVRRT